MEVNANLTLKLAGNKVFRNGITGTANLTQDELCGQFQIGTTTATAVTAVLGGTGVINLGANHGFINSGCVTTMTSDKTINFGSGGNTFRVSTGGTLLCGNFVLGGTATFAVSANATLGMGSSVGITASTASPTGNIQSTTARVFDVAAHYIYNGAFNQITGTGLPTTVASLTVSNIGAASDNTVSLTTTNTTTDSLLLASGFFAIGTGAQLNINGTKKKVVSTAGDFASGTTGGIVNFPTGGLFAGSCNPYDVYISNIVDFGAGTVRIQNGGSLRINAGVPSVPGISNGPFYSVGSTLIYNTGGVFAANGEWVANVAGSANRGAPHHVTTMTSLTSVNFGSAGSAHIMGGNLDIGSGTFFALSTVGGGDLTIGGNWTRAASGAFTHNNRTVTFNGATTNQTITVTLGGTEVFAYITINKPIANPNLILGPSTNITVNGGNAGGNTLVMTAGNLDLNQNTLNFNSYNGGQNNILINGVAGNYVRTITSTGGQGTFAILNSDGSVRTAAFIRSGVDPNKKLTISSTVKLTIGGTSNAAGIDFGFSGTPSAYLTTLNGTLQINPNGFVSTNAPVYGVGSTLIYNTGGGYYRSIEWLPAGTVSTGISGSPYHVTTLAPNTVVTLNNGAGIDRSLGGTLTISNNTGVILNELTFPQKLTIGIDLILDGTLTLPPTLASFGADIWLNGNWTRSSTGLFVPNERAVFFVGGGNSTVTAVNGELFPYVYLTKNALANTVFLDDNISVGKILGVRFGTLDLKNKNVTFKSDASNTASLEKVTLNSGAIAYTGTGRFVIERFIPTALAASSPLHRKSWQLLAVPVSDSAQTIKQAWQEGSLTANGNPNSGYGTQITSDVPNATVQPKPGFDMVSVAGPSMKTYVPLTNTWRGVDSTGVKIINQKGYMVFVRGDRSVSTFSPAVVPTTTLRATGKIYDASNINPPTTNVTNGLFETVGNPYPSAIDFSNEAGVVKNANLARIFYVWDPKLGGGQGYGAYQTFTKEANPGTNYKVSPGGGSYGVLNSFQNIVQSGQAIFVRASGGTGTISFNEDAKVAGSSLVTRLVNTIDNSRQISNLLYAVSNGERVLLDGVVSEFDRSFSNNVDILDALKLTNTGENISISKSTDLLAVERRGLIHLHDSIPYKLSNMRIQHYEFEFAAQHIARPGLKAFLFDKWLDTYSPVGLTDTTRIGFDINVNPGSYVTDRFKLVFSRKEKKQLYSQLTALSSTDANVLSWTSDADIDADLIVERSIDGINFTAIHTEVANQSGSYSWTDHEPVKGPCYYRILNSGSEHEKSYSNTVKLALVSSGKLVKLLQNPVSDGTIRLAFPSSIEGIYKIGLFNSSSQQVVNTTFKNSGAVDNHEIKLPALLAAGIYSLQVTYPDGHMQYEKILVE